MKKFSWKLTAALAVSLSILLSSTVFPVNLRADGEEDGYPVIEEVEQIDEESEEQEEEKEEEEKDVKEDENVEQDENVEEEGKDVEEKDEVENENDVDIEEDDIDKDVTEDEKNAEIEDVDQPRLGADEEPMYEGEIGDDEPEEEGYPLFIAGYMVTDKNKDDLSSIEGVTVAESGRFKYDPDSNTLYLNKVTINNTTGGDEEMPFGIYYCGSEDLKICVEGDTSISSMSNCYSVCIYISYSNGRISIDDVERLRAAEDDEGEDKYPSGIIEISKGATLTLAFNEATGLEYGYGYGYGYGYEGYATTYGIQSDNDVTITGAGAFDIQSGYFGIYSNCDVIIENTGASSIVAGEYGIYANRDLKLTNSKLTVDLPIDYGTKGVFADGVISISGKMTELTVTASRAVSAYDDYARRHSTEHYTNKTPEEVIKIEAPLYILTPENGFVCHNSSDFETDSDPDYYICDPSIQSESDYHDYDDEATKVVIKADLVKVDFETNGGSEIESQDLAVGETVEKPADPTKSGYEFVGWFTDSECTKEFDFSTKVDKDMTLYAKWEECGKYVVVAGPSGSRAIGDGDMTIIVKHTKHDEKTHEKLKGVKFNGKPVDVKSVKKGSAIITIDGSLLDSLESGDYTITIEFEDGEASTFVSILNAAQSAAEDTAPTGVPKTGDTSSSSSNLGFVFLAAAAIAGALIILENKKMREQD